MLITTQRTTLNQLIYMKQNINILSKVPFFDGLPEEQLIKINHILITKHIQKETFIFYEGDEGDGFYIIMSGMVKIFKVSPNGKEQILHIFGSGEMFGEVPMFSGMSFPAHAQAIQKCNLLFLPKKPFVDLLINTPSITLNMLSVLSKRLRQFTLQIENLSLKEIPGRIASYLLYLSKEQEDSTLVTLDISKGHLASLLGTIPETLSRIFAKMATEGLITVNGKEISIENMEGLIDLSLNGKLELK